jgi:hypothetical protein
MMKFLVKYAMTESLTSSICKLADAMVMSDSLGADKLLCNVGFSVGHRSVYLAKNIYNMF